MPTYKLYYFDSKGRAELTRFLFAYGEIDYEDIRLKSEDWQKDYKSKSPFGQMPMLEVDGTMIAQSNTIARLVAKRIGLAGKNDLEEARANMIVDCVEDVLKAVISIFFGDDAAKAAAKEKFENEQRDKFLGYFEKFLEENKTGYFVGDDFTWADFAFVLALAWVKHASETDFTKYKRIAELENRVNSNSKIAAWISKRPKTEY